MTGAIRVAWGVNAHVICLISNTDGRESAIPLPTYDSWRPSSRSRASLGLRLFLREIAVILYCLYLSIDSGEPASRDKWLDSGRRPRLKTSINRDGYTTDVTRPLRS